jgi:hypothetical protein
MNISTTTTTTTMTLAAVIPHYKIRLKGEVQELDPKQKLEELSEILTTFQEWEDLLSCEIMLWSEKALSIDIHNEETTTPQALLIKFEKDIDTLFREVLVSSGLKTPLTDPLLEGEVQSVGGLRKWVGMWTWERAEVIDYCQKYASPISPFNFTTEININAMMPHDFAIAMLQWAKGLPFTPGSSLLCDQIAGIEGPHNQIIPLNLQSLIPTHGQEIVPLGRPTHTQMIVPLTGDDAQRHAKIAKKELKTHIACGQMANERRHTLQLCGTLAKGRKDFKMSADKVREYAVLHVANERRRAAQQKEEILGCIKEMDESHTRTIKIADQRLDAQIQRTEYAFQQLELSEQKAELQRVRIEHLNASFQEKCREVQQLRSQSGGGGCTIL